MASYLYLHGFASSPLSAKAQFLGDRFRQAGIPLNTPDLNQDDFFHLTLSRQLHQARAEFPAEPAPVTVIGSSLGGLTAAWLGEQHMQVDRLVLLAPAFQFLAHWLPKLGDEQMQRWALEQSMSVYHYSMKHDVPLSYDFVTDAMQYDDHQIRRPVPTLILHGRGDEVVPIDASRNFASDRPWVRLIELDSDHALGNVLDEIWDAIQEFCTLDLSRVEV
jgi:uncharacterized protein